MMRSLVVVWFVFLAATAVASPIAVTLSGKFGAPDFGTSIFDNQNYSINFLILDPASPSSAICCAGQIEADYSVLAHFEVPGIGFSLNTPVQASYVNQLPLGKWLNIFSFTGLPVGDVMVLTPLQINSGELWNGLAGPLGTPVINPLNSAPGTARFFLEQSTNQGLIPIAVYSNGPVSVTALEIPPPPIPEPATWSLATAALLALGLWRRINRSGALNGTVRPIALRDVVRLSNGDSTLYIIPRRESCDRSFVA